MPLRILIIDDDDDIRNVARIALARVGGMEVIEACNGRDGLAAAERERPDAILVDVMMPGFDGPATLAALRANPATVDLPVVFLTAKVLPSEVERLRALGAKGVLMKPFDPMRLASEVRATLGVDQ